MSSSATAELRTATSSEHRELEEVVSIAERLESLESYRELLESFYGFVAPLERLLGKFDWKGVGLNFNERCKASLLAADLRDLGVDPKELPLCRALPQLTNEAAACGALYVMEGSTLGGQQILRLATKAGLPPNTLRYFSSYGDRVGAMWRSFGEVINRYESETSSLSQMVDGAQQTFQTLRNWFEHCLVKQ